MKEPQIHVTIGELYETSRVRSTKWVNALKASDPAVWRGGVHSPENAIKTVASLAYLIGRLQKYVDVLAQSQQEVHRSGPSIRNMIDDMNQRGYSDQGASAMTLDPKKPEDPK